MTEIKPKICVEYADNATIATFTDKKILDDQDIAAVGRSLLSVVEQAEGINLILDFRNVHFLSSAVLGLLIRLSKRVYELNGQLKLCSIHPRIYEVFRITRLTKVFEIYKDLESAMESCSTAG